jgi:Bacterial Ig domain
LIYLILRASGVTVNAITAAPASGKVSINTDNTISYLPNVDFFGTDNFTYQVINTAGYTATATVAITVSNNACDGATYQTAAGVNVTLALTATNDTNLDEVNPTRNNGTCTALKIDGRSTRALRNLYKFDVSTIPTTATINTANLTLVSTAVTSNTAYTINAHRLTRAWTDGTLCAAAGVPNWTNSATGVLWTTAGGDFNAAVEANTSVTTTGTYNWSMNSLVQSWVNLTNTNNGVLLKYANEALAAGDGKTFGSKEDILANRPTLNITYTTAPTCAAIPARAPMAQPDLATTNSLTAINIATATNDYYPLAGAKTYSLLFSLFRLPHKAQRVSIQARAVFCLRL